MRPTTTGEQTSDGASSSPPTLILPPQSRGEGTRGRGEGQEAASTYWRSLDELAGTSDAPSQEFPGFANVYEGSSEVEVEASALTRRQFVSLSAAALGLAGLVGCRRPDLQILPYTQTPEHIVPGVPLFYATSLPKPGGCFPVLVESHEGRPTKIEGHPKHPESLGGSDAHTQAEILYLYSPDRSKQVLKRADDGTLVPKSWEEFDAFAPLHFAALRKQDGEGLRFLVEDNPSPALRLLREHVQERFPKAVWHVYEPIDEANAREGSKLAFGFTRKGKAKDDKGEDVEKDVVTPLAASPDFRRAYRIVSLDCDFLGLEGNMVANGRGFAELRSDPHVRHLFNGAKHEHTKDEHADPSAEMSRLYVIENTYTVTGTMADHRLRLPASHVVDYAIALAKEFAALRRAKIPAPVRAALEKAPAGNVEISEAWVREVAADLTAFEGRGLVLAGRRQPPLVHALAAFINDVLGNAGKTVEYRPVVDEGSQSVKALADAISAGEVKTLVIAGGNPAYTAPADLAFAQRLGEVPTTIRLGLFVDETSEKCTWHLPQAHALESWGDAETDDGSYCVVQPLIAPLHGGRSLLELLIQWSAWDKASSYADAKAKAFNLLRESFKKRAGSEDELAFKRFIQDGHIRDSARPVVKPMLAAEALARTIGAHQPSPAVTTDSPEIAFHPHYGLYDGRHAWNSWLLELPDPITKLVWDNAALVSPKTAESLQARTGDMLEITVANASIKVPAFVLPGQADGSISLTLGHGKLRPAHAGEGGGFNVYPLRTSGAHFARGTARKTGETYDLVTTQEHGTIPAGRDEDIVRDLNLDDHEKRLHESHENAHHADDPKTRFQWGYANSNYKDAGQSMRDIKRIAIPTVESDRPAAQDISYPERLNGHMQWGMVIDLNVCTGCSACVVACQSENNIPVVGRGEVKRNREMHWISVHRYFSTNKDVVRGGLESPPQEDPRIVAQPMMCQHCEAAPCESVCPVNAAVHSPEGLNLQVYNRCIGTRYCSNNCPYKARRFNWFDFNKRRLDELRVPTPFSEAGVPETLKMQKNPEVTVRMRGVMEKCTYCIQRIERAKIGAKVAAAKAGADRIDSSAPPDPYQAGYDIRQYEGLSRIIVPDGIIKTACEQACPTGAIVFGNVRDERSRVFRLKNVGADYLALGGLNAKPRTSYLPRLRNPNPKMGEGA